MGIFHHPPPADLQAAGVEYHEVADTWFNEAVAFASSYAAKSAVFLRKIPRP